MSAFENVKVADIEFGPNHRMVDESYEDYRSRLRTEKLLMKHRQRFGLRRWDSVKNGTYRKTR